MGRKKKEPFIPHFDIELYDGQWAVWTGGGLKASGEA